MQPFVFGNHVLRPMRLVYEDNQSDVWFLLHDVSEMTRHSLKARDLDRWGLRRYIDYLTVNASEIPLDDHRGVRGQRIILSEAGLYMLGMGARAGLDRSFQYWLADEVLPGLRRDGYYISEDHPLIAELREQIAHLGTRLAFAEMVQDGTLSDLVGTL